LLALVSFCLEINLTNASKKSVNIGQKRLVL